MILLLKVKSNTSSKFDSSGLQEEIFPHFSAPYFILTGSGWSRGGKKDTQGPVHLSLLLGPQTLLFFFLLVTFGQLMWRD